jgi:D-xylose transport system substrate-binding protein
MKSKRLFKAITLAVVTVITTAALVGCSGSKQTSSNGDNKKKADDGIKIGMTIDDLRLERWQHDRDLFTAKAKELGAKEVLVQSANGDDQTQYSQAENLISQGVDVLVIIPHNGEAMAPIIEEAHKNGIKVLAYDRLITNSDVDYYVSFNNVKVGELQAQAITKEVPKGNYFMMGGSPTDNNAQRTGWQKKH